MPRTKGKRTIVVDVKPSDWHAAEESWMILRQTTGNIGYTSLRDFQTNLWAKVKQDPKSVVGEPVLVITDSAGNMFSNYPYPATILKAFEAQGHLLLKVIYHPIEEENWTGERIEDVRLYQVMPLYQATQAEETAKEKVYLDLLLTRLNGARNKELDNLRQKEQSLIKSITSIRKDLKRYETQLEQTTDKLKDAEKDFLTIDTLKEMLEQLTHNKKVASAMITRNGELVVETNMLYYVDRKTNKENKHIEIGRFALYINPQTNDIAAQNLVYRYSNHGHMNLSDTDICLGENSDNVHSMIQAGKFYDLVDFMILFFSIFPHDAGDGGYVSAEAWLEEKSRYTIQNPWGRLPALYKVNQDVTIANRKTKQKGNMLTKAVKTMLPTLSDKERKLADEEKEIVIQSRISY